MEQNTNKQQFMQGLRDGVPVSLGYFAVSFTFGMMAVAGGMSVWQATLLSLTNITSAGQFAGLEIIIACGSLWEMALTQQSEIQSDVFFCFSEAAEKYTVRAQISCGFWYDG